MESLNQSPSSGERRQLSLDEAFSQVAQARAQAQANSRFVRIENGERKTITLTGNVYERKAQGTNEAGDVMWQSDKLDFEVAEKTPKGESKFFSISKKSQVAQRLLDLLKQGIKTVDIARDEKGRYAVYKVS